MDLFIVAMSRFKRHKFDQTIELCNQMLATNPDDQVSTTSFFKLPLPITFLGSLAPQMQQSHS